MTTINYKDPSLKATELANGIMSSDDKFKLDHLALTFDGYATITDLASETTRAQNAEAEIRGALDGYVSIDILDSYATISYVNNELDGYAPSNNLSKVLFVDVGTSVVSLAQNGNVETPFRDITSAVAAFPKTNTGLVLNVVPGDYTGESTVDLTGCGQTTFVNLGVQSSGATGSFAIQNLAMLGTLQSNSMITLQGCQILNAFTDSIRLCDSVNVGNIQVNSGFSAESSLWLNDGVTPTLTSFGGPLRFDQCYFQGGGDVIFKTDNANPIELYRCTFTMAIIVHFTGPAGVLKIDNFTYQQWLGLGCTLVNGTISIVDPSLPHALTHIAGGNDAIDGYYIPITYSTVNYTQPVDGYIGEHIAGIDKKLGLVYQIPNVSAVALTNINVGSPSLTPSNWDGVTPVTGQRVILYQQSTASENGIWIIPVSGALIRSNDTIVCGSRVFVEQGEVYKSKSFVQTTIGPIVVGSTSQIWSCVDGPALAAPLTTINASGAGAWTTLLTIPGPTVDGYDLELVVDNVAARTDGYIVVRSRGPTTYRRASGVTTLVDDSRYLVAPTYLQQVISGSNILLQGFQQAAGNGNYTFRIRAWFEQMGSL